MEEKQKTLPLVDYVLNFLKKNKNSLDGFDQYLIKYSGHPKNKIKFWPLFRNFILELSSGPVFKRNPFEHRLDGLLIYYYQLCNEPHSAYLDLPDGPEITAWVIFRLRKCFPRESTLMLSAYTITNLLSLVTKPGIMMSPKACCNALLGSGYLALDAHLRGEVPEMLANHLLVSIVNQKDKADPKYLCNLLLALGYLARHWKLNGRVSAQSVNQLLHALLQKAASLSSWHLGNALLGVGYLATQGRMVGEPDPNLVNALLGELAKKHKSGPNRPIDMNNGLVGVGQIVRQYTYMVFITWEHVEVIITSLIEAQDEDNTANLCKAIINTAFLTQRCLIPANVKPLNLIKVFTRLSSETAPATLSEISNLIYGTGLIAQHCRQLVPNIDIVLLHQLLKKINPENIHSKAQLISQIFVGIGLLAVNRCLFGSVDVVHIQGLLSFLVTLRNSADPMDLSNALLVILDLTLGNNLQGSLDGELFNQLLDSFTTKQPIDLNSICHALNVTIHLAILGRLQHKINAAVINTLLGILLEHRNKVHPRFLVQINTNVCHALSFIDGDINIRLILGLMGGPSNLERSPEAAIIMPPSLIPKKPEPPEMADLPALQQIAEVTERPKQIVEQTTVVLAPEPAKSPTPDPSKVVTTRRKKKKKGRKEEKSAQTDKPAEQNNRRAGPEFFPKITEQVKEKKPERTCSCQPIIEFVQTKLKFW